MKPMEKELVENLLSLKAAMKEDPRLQRLDSLERRISQDPKVIELAQKKDAAERAYADALSYRKLQDPEVLSLQKALYSAKLALDEDPLANEYNAAYIAVRDLYMAIDDILFKDFRKKSLFEGTGLC
jgi:hypothetical protein